MLTDKQIKAFAMKDDEYCSDVITDKLVQKLINTFSSERAQIVAEKVSMKLPKKIAANISEENERDKLIQEWDEEYEGDYDFKDFITLSECSKYCSAPYIYQLKNETNLKKFYLKYPEEQEYLFSKVPSDRLEEFSERIFSLADILKCKYISSYLKFKNLSLEDFQELIINYAKNRKKINVENVQEYIEDEAVIFINNGYADQANECLSTQFEKYDSFKRNKQMYLIKTMQSIFNDKNIMDEFKEGKYYKFNSIESVFLFYIMDDKNIEDIKHIRFNEWDLVSRNFINTLKKYVLSISNDRNLRNPYIIELFEKRILKLKSDLPEIRDMIDSIESMILSTENQNSFKDIKKEIKKCIDKLKQFKKRQKKYQI